MLKEIHNGEKMTDKEKQALDINWDAIQRRRFANADAEIAPDDNFTPDDNDEDSLVDIIYGNKD